VAAKAENQSDGRGWALKETTQKLEKVKLGAGPSWSTPSM